MDTFIPRPFVPAPEPRLFYAEVIYERIEEHVQDALTDLPEDEEITVFVPLNDGARIVVESFGFHNPGFIIVYGIDTATGNNAEAFVSHTNIQFLISRSKKQQEKPQRRIGFLGGTA